MRIIIGLGNPGKDYQTTRHNIGFMAIDTLHKRHSFPTFTHEKKLKAEISGTIIDGVTTLLVKPQTFMNKSGEAVLAIKQYYKCSWSDLLIIYDDIDIPLGEIRFREKGSPGTHNGMRSIIQLAGTQEIPRLRLGIRPNHPISDLSSFVLGRFTEDEMAVVGEVLEEVKLLQNIQN